MTFVATSVLVTGSPWIDCRASKPVGIEVNWPGVVGGNVELQQGRRDVSFILSAGCRRLVDSAPFADMGWYLKTLVPALVPLGLAGVVTTDGYLD